MSILFFNSKCFAHSGYSMTSGEGERDIGEEAGGVCVGRGVGR